MNKKDLVAKRLLMENKKATARTICSLLLFFIVLPLIAFSALYDENNNPEVWQIFLCGGLLIVEYFIFYKVDEHVEKKKINDLISFEKEMGYIYLFNACIYKENEDYIKTLSPFGEEKDVTREEKYYLRFNPFLNNSSIEIRYEIPEHLYEKYQEKINRERTFDIFKDSLVIIEESTGLLDAERFARREGKNFDEKFVY